MSLGVALFAVLAAVTAGSAVGVVLAKSVVRAAVWLLFTLVGVSLLYFLLGAEFLGAAQLLVYVGGTMVLLAFGVMLTSSGPDAGFRPGPLDWAAGGLLAAAVFGLLARTALDPGREAPTAEPGPLPGTEALGAAFLGPYLLPFEVVSVHLLVVLIAAAYLARAKRRPQP